MAEQEKDKKLIIDEDWKNQAQREKEKLAEQEAQEEQDEGGEEEMGLPPADLSGLASMLATQAFFALGLIGREGEPQRQPDFVLAKFHIDMLEMLDKKTAGNRTDDETKVLTGTLGQLRMAFVQLAEKAS